MPAPEPPAPVRTPVRKLPARCPRAAPCEATAVSIQLFRYVSATQTGHIGPKNGRTLPKQLYANSCSLNQNVLLSRVSHRHGTIGKRP